MLKRTLTALLLIPPVVYLIGWSPKWLFVLAVAVAVVLALREYFALCRAMGFKVFSWIGYGRASCCAWRLLIGRLYLNSDAVTSVLVGIFAADSHLGPAAKHGFEGLSRGHVGNNFWDLVYRPLSFVPGADSLCRRFTRRPRRFIETHDSTLEVGPQPILLLFLVIWAGDICAYLVGRPFGRTPFFARISPRKTWEGALAGLAGSLLAAWAFAALVLEDSRRENGYSACSMDRGGGPSGRLGGVRDQAGGQSKGFRHPPAGPRRISRPH